VCESVSPPFVSAVSHGAYEGTLRALIHLLKYEGVAPAARPLGKLLLHAISQIEPRLPADTVVVAVPLHPAKERQRGFNQSEQIALEALAEIRRTTGKERFKLERNALRRARSTDSQFGLTARERRRNLKGAFTVAKPDAIRGKTVLLIDDIYTTGATARECARTLRAAGASHVYVATLARAQRDGVAHWNAEQFVTTPVTFHSGGSTLTAS
jgi:ComF family protein